MNFEITKLNVVPMATRSGEPFKHRNKLYVFIEGESIIENVISRQSRPYDAYKRFVLPAVLQQMKTKFPNQYEAIKDTKWSWRQKCGCSMCPCSPGFVSEREGHTDIYVTIK